MTFVYSGIFPSLIWDNICWNSSGGKGSCISALYMLHPGCLVDKLSKIVSNNCALHIPSVRNELEFPPGRITRHGAHHCVHTQQINAGPDPKYCGSHQKVNILLSLPRKTALLRLLYTPFWATNIKSGDDYCQLLVLDCVSALGLFLLECRRVYCPCYNWPHPVFSLNAPKALCTVVSFYMVSLVNLLTLSTLSFQRQTPDNGGIYHCLFLWNLVNIFPLISSPNVCAVPWWTVGEINRICRPLFQVAQERVTRSFHRINMTELFKRQNIAWDYMYTW